MRNLASPWNLALAGAVVLITCVSTFPRSPSLPAVVPDELVYLSVARYLAGAAPLPDFHRSYFYEPGLSILMAPAFWFGASPPETAFARAMFINACLAGLLPLPLVGLLRRWGYTPPVALFSAVVAALFPAVLVQARHALPEVAFATLFATLAVLFGQIVDRPSSTRAAILAGLAIAGLPALHPRGVPVAAAALVILAWLVVRRSVSLSRGLATTATCALAWFVLLTVDRHLIERGWTGDTVHRATSLLSKLIGDEGLHGFATAVSGQIWYLTAATCGLFIVGAAEVARRLIWTVPARTRLAQSADLLLLVAGSLGVLFVSGLHMTPGAIPQGHLDHVDAKIYGRYIEATIYPLIALGVAASCAAGRERRLGVGAAAILLTTFGFLAFSSRAVLDGHVIHDNVLGLAAFAGFDGFCASMPAIGAITAGLSGLIALSARFSPWAPGLVLAVFFLLTTWRGIDLSGANHYVDNSERLDDLIGSLEVPEVSYDLAVLQDHLFVHYQYLLPGVRFHTFDSRQGESPTAAAVISNQGAAPAGSHFVWKELGQTLWVSKESAGSAFDYRRYVFGVEESPWVRRTGLGPVVLLGDVAVRNLGPQVLFEVPVNAAPAKLVRLDLVVAGRAPLMLEVRAGDQHIEKLLAPGPRSLVVELDLEPDQRLLQVGIKGPVDQNLGWIGFHGMMVTDTAATFTNETSAEAPEGSIEILAPRPVGIAPGGGLPLHLRLTNTGPTPWPAGPRGKLVLRWISAGHETQRQSFELPVNVLPARDLEMSIPLTAATMEPGHYEIEVVLSLDGLLETAVANAGLSVRVGDPWPLCNCT